MSYIYVYDSNQWGSISGLGYNHKIEINSVADMVGKVLKATEGQKYSSTLILAGDGGINYQSVGAGANLDTSGDRSLQLNNQGNLKGAASVWIPRLKDRIGVLRLKGVDDAESRSTKLFLAIANLLATGCRITGNHSVIINYGKSSRRARRITRPATLQNGTLRQRLAELDATSN